MNERPRMLPQTGELAAIHAKADAVEAAYRASQPAPVQPIEASEIPIERKSGFVVYFTHEQQPYTVTAGCQCLAEAMTLTATLRPTDKTCELTVCLTCRQHGARPSIAFVVNTAPRTLQQRAVFAWADEHARRKVAASHIPTWGYSGRQA